jgi:Putative peptidoglycan binding domain
MKWQYRLSCVLAAGLLLVFPELGLAHGGGGGGHGGGGGGGGHGFGGGGFGGHGFGRGGFGGHGFRSSFAGLSGRGLRPGFSGTRFADRGFFDRGDRGRFGRFDGGGRFGRFDRGDRFGRFDRDDRFFFRRNFFVGFDFAAFGFPGWWDWGYPYDYGYYPYGNAYYGDNASYGDASTFDYKYWNNLAVSVQSELSRSGYYTGQIDGVIGSGSRQAIREFQTKQGLPVTGRIDPKLLDSLGIDYKRGQS